MHQPSHPDWIAFAKAMRANRLSDTPRLVFADWLEDSHPHLAGYIRAACRVALHYPTHTHMTDVRSPNTGRAHLDRLEDTDLSVLLLQPTIPCFDQILVMFLSFDMSWKRFPFFKDCYHKSDWRFKRGFPWKIVCSWQHWADHAASIIALGPVEEVVLTTPSPLAMQWSQTMRSAAVYWPETCSLRPLVKTPQFTITRKDLYASGENGLYLMQNAIRLKMLAEIWPDDLVQTFTIREMLS